MDYKDFKGENEPKERLGERWWEDTDADACKELLAVARQLQRSAQPRHQQNLVHARLYSNFDLIGFGARDYTRALVSTPISPSLAVSRIGYNVIGSVIEALSSKIGKNRPRPTYITSGGTWKQQQSAKRLTSFMHGWFHESRVYQEAVLARLDAYVFGTGALFVYRKGDKVCVERQFTDELYVDDSDGKYGKPRQLFRRKVLDRSVLHAKFSGEKNYRTSQTDDEGALLPSLFDLIEQAQKPPDETTLVTTGSVSDPVEVWEAWHLSSKRGAKDGRYIMTVSSGALVNEEYTLDKFPFVFRRYRPRLLGFWGTGIAEILTPIQVEMNRTLRSISEQLRRKGRGRIYAPINSIDINQLNNAYGAVAYYRGSVAPTIDNSPAVSPDEVAHLRQLKADAFEEVGLSQLSATSKKPSGLDAAVAMREYNDIETERFALDAQADEQMYLDVAELVLEIIRAEMPDYVVAVPQKRYAKEVRWSEIQLKPGEYIGQMFPVSSLPSTPGARLQRVEELRMGGYIDLGVAKKLLDFPDLEAEMTLANAAIEDCDALIGNILDEDKPKFEMPDEFMNMPLLVERATAAYLFARRHGADEQRLQMMRELITVASAKMAAVAAATTPPAAPAAPGAAPALAPQGAGPSPVPGPALPPPVAPA